MDLKNRRSLWMPLALLAMSGGALANPPEGGAGGGAEPAAKRVANPALSGMRLDPSHPQWKAYIAQQRKEKIAERELKKIRYQHFVAKGDVENRRLGLEKLRTFTDPLVYPAILRVFQDDGLEVKRGLLEHFAAQGNDEALAAIAWAAIFSRDGQFRDAAHEKLGELLKDKPAPIPVQSMVAEGLSTPNRTVLGAAGGVAQSLKLWDAIPMMIAGQVMSPRDDGDPNQVIAWIMIGTQRAFVADLIPVVGDSAVAFDPVIGVLTEGTILKVQNAVVTTLATELHQSLVGLTTEGMGGKSTAHLGYDRNKWAEWYKNEWLPRRAELERQEAARRAAGERPKDDPWASLDSMGGAATDVDRSSDKKSSGESASSSDRKSQRSTDSSSQRDASSSSNSSGQRDSSSSSNSSSQRDSSSSSGRDAATQSGQQRTTSNQSSGSGGGKK
ncbi:MAG: hypothetical protein KIT68_05125 [Phycisphaeraceae bacterium]|nr:hypothetical protein [Phycisphaeraceae bacterium]